METNITEHPGSGTGNRDDIRTGNTATRNRGNRRRGRGRGVSLNVAEQNVEPTSATNLVTKPVHKRNFQKQTAQRGPDDVVHVEPCSTQPNHQRSYHRGGKPRGNFSAGPRRGAPTSSPSVNGNLMNAPMMPPPLFPTGLPPNRLPGYVPMFPPPNAMMNPNATEFVPRGNRGGGRRPDSRGGRGRGGANGNRGRGGARDKLPTGPDKIKSPNHRRVFKTKNNDDPDRPLRERLIQQLEDFTYECMICCQTVMHKQGIWTCKKCYHMFHISNGCITNWAKKSKESDNKWRCPTCQTKYETIPYSYRCFCGKERNPTPHHGEVPHSCGRVCGGSRGHGCPHPCNEPCHPGPCAECPVMITRKCSCGATEKAVRCGTDLKITCENICGRMRNCGEHACEQKCHVGPCAPCDRILKTTCHCGSETREILCAPSVNKEFSCGKPCEGTYDCGLHKCQAICHARNEDNCGVCPTDPDRITHCPCGRKTLIELGKIRNTCDDEVPTCEEFCNKLLECGPADCHHRCRSKCHTGPCPPCGQTSSLKCRCRRITTTLPCSEYLALIEKGEYRCDQRCRKKKLCGIHKCGERCCIDLDHICMKICGKRLECGLHTCDNICHAGNCPRCLNASFEEQFCHCGRTMRPPPIPCGAPLPECDEPCARPHGCNHPVNHRCHSEQRCPPCTFLVEKWCYGKHEVRKNVPCHLEAVSCGRICQNMLPCGVHPCNRMCHGGECGKEGEVCRRKCAKLRTGCEHPCGTYCHGSDKCPDTQCAALVEVTCECGRIRNKTKCVEVERIRARMRAVIAESAESVPMTGRDVDASPGLLKRSTSTEKLNCLSCNDECKRIARNKRFADALDVAVDDEGRPEHPLTITYTENLKNEFRVAPQTILELEAIYKSLLDKLNDPTSAAMIQTFHFKPMSLERRRLIHEYAVYYQIDTIGVDDPPKRSVIATARRGKSKAPLALLSSFANYPGSLKTMGDSVLWGTEAESLLRAPPKDEGGMKTVRAERPAVRREPPRVALPVAPVKQTNAFALLGSSDAEEDDLDSLMLKEKARARKMKIKTETEPIDYWDNSPIVASAALDDRSQVVEKSEAIQESIKAVNDDDVGHVVVDSVVKEEDGVQDEWDNEV